MSKLRYWLSGLLLLQLLVASGLYWHSWNGGSPAAADLFTFDPDAVDRVVIDDGKQQLTLEKAGGHWVLPRSGSLPADAGKLGDILTRTRSLQSGWPVATTEGARARFKVADDGFQRHLQFYRGKQPVADLLVGTSSGFRQSHVRRVGDDAIYLAGINGYELGATADAWLDKTLLSAGDIRDIQGGDFDLQREDDHWAFEGDGAPQQSPDKKKADRLADALGDLRVLALSDQPLGQPSATLKVSSGDRVWTYQFAQQDGHYLVRRDDIDGVFTIDQVDYDLFTQPDKSTLAASTDTNASPGDVPAQGDESHS